MHKRISNLLSRIRKYYKQVIDRNLHWYFIFSLVICFIWFGYENDILKKYDEFIIPILSQFRSSGWSIALIIFFVCLVATNIVIKFKNKYQYNPILIFIIAWMSFIATLVHASGLYKYACFWGVVPYFDVIVLCGFVYTVFAIVNVIRITKREKDQSVENKQQQIDNANTLLEDWPIYNKKYDIFFFSTETKEIAKKITSLDRNKTWSLAITAPWGSGKTSFINLIREELTPNLFDVILFNPRDCKSYDKIQEDFFNTLGCILGKYSSKFNGTIKKYMASLLLIDNRGIFEKLFNFYHIWNKEDLKEDLKEVFRILPKRVLVVIDDYDRLSREEILEVLKLIDSNADFSNLIFLTAFDKKQVNKVLGDENRTDDAYFVDKFFNLEISIPPRQYTYILDFLRGKLIIALKAIGEEVKTIEDAINSNYDIYSQYLPTLRDAKRFINQVALDYENVRGEVNVNEFFLVQLIKYRYLDDYKRLFNQEFLIQSYNGAFLTNTLCLKQDIDKNLVILPILKKIFPDSKEKKDAKSSFRHIFNPLSFNNYFEHRIFAALKIKDLKIVYDENDFNKVTSIIDQWLIDYCKATDFIDYLSTFNMDNFGDGNKYERFSDIVTYTATKSPDSQAYWLFIRLIYKSNLDGYEEKYNLNLEQYKSRLFNILTNKSYDKQLRLVRSLFRQIQLQSIHQDDIIFSKDDLWRVVIDEFKSALQDSIDENEKLSWLYSCIDHIEDGTRKIVLNRECADEYRQYVEKSPKNYISGFVRLGMITTDPTYNAIACEPFCTQIFGSYGKVEDFLHWCLDNNVEKAGLCCSFWRLYKANAYKPIDFHNQGVVQEKIDNGLIDEIKMLDELERIKLKVDAIPKTTDGMNDDSITENKQKLIECKERLDKANLFVRLNGQIREKIDTLKPIYNL